MGIFIGIMEYWNTGMIKKRDDVLQDAWARSSGSRRISRTVRRTVPAILFALLLLSGCTTYDSQVKEVRTHYLAGRYEEAQKLTAKEVESSGETGVDALVWQLENATILRTSGKVPESNEAFEKARTLYTKNLDEARIRILQGGAAMLTTPANLPYYGTGYDGLLIDTYQTLNAMQTGDLDRARVNITRSYLLQKEIVQANSERIEKEKNEIAKDKNVEKSMQLNKDLSDGTDITSFQNELTAYADYVNPFSVYLDGLYHLTQALDSSDVERARKSLERVSAFAPNNAAVSNDLAIATRAVSLPDMPPSVYIIFETGMAPSLDQVRIDIPIIITVVSYVGISFPKLHLHPEFVPHLMFKSPETELQRTERIVSMDAVITREFKNNFPSIMAKAVASAVTKAVAATAMNIAAKEADNPWVSLATQATTAAYQLATNIADTRSWQTLPKEIQIARLNMPQERSLRLATADGTWQQDVTVIPGHVVVIYVKSTSPASPLTINQFKLK
jgi:hypothetical protein